MALRKIGKYYHVYWQDQGRQHTMSLHVTDKQEALRVERQAATTTGLKKTVITPEQVWWKCFANSIPDMTTHPV
jgi:hypothetical protein